MLDEKMIRAKKAEEREYFRKWVDGSKPHNRDELLKTVAKIEADENAAYETDHAIFSIIFYIMLFVVSIPFWFFILVISLFTGFGFFVSLATRIKEKTLGF